MLSFLWDLIYVFAREQFYLTKTLLIQVGGRYEFQENGEKYYTLLPPPPAFLHTAQLRFASFRKRRGGMNYLSTHDRTTRCVYIKCRWMELSPPTTRSFYLLPPPPAFRHPHPRAWKRRGGMIIISTRECTRRCVYIKCRWMELSPPNTEIPYRNSYLNSLVKSYRRGRFATAPSMEFLLSGADAIRP